MKPVDLKLTQADKTTDQAKYAIGSVETKGPDYSYGTRISLGDAELKKLGVTEMPKGEAEYTITGTVKVSGTRSEDRGGKVDRNVDLQITHLALQAKGKEKTPEQTLYDNDGDEG